MQELLPGVFQYRVWRPGSFRGVSFNGTYLAPHPLSGGSERVLIDPPPLNAWELEHVDALGAPTTIVVTNANHLRAAPELRERFDAKLLVPAADRAQLEAEVDGTFADGDEVAGLRVIALQQQKTPGETALYEPERKLLILGDALIGTPEGSVSLLPAAKFEDPAAAREGLRPLLELEVEALLLGDGASLTRGVREALLAYFREVPEVPLADATHGRVPQPGAPGWYVINVADELEWWGNDAYGFFASFEGQSGRFTEVGVNVTVVAPGQPACLYHRESCQEGFLVLQGEALLLIEEETRPLRRWDYVHMPPGTAHVLVGAGEGPAAVLMLGARPKERGINYPVSALAEQHGAGGKADFDSPEEAYGSVPGLKRPEPRPYTWPFT